MSDTHTSGRIAPNSAVTTALPRLGLITCSTAAVRLHAMRLCFTLCGTRAMLHARSRDGIRKDGKIGGLGARAEAEGLDCRARRSRLDRLVGEPRRRGLSNLWYGAQFPAWLVCSVSSGLAGARDVGLDPGHASHVTKWGVADRHAQACQRPSSTQSEAEPNFRQGDTSELGAPTGP
jgi:hypothetical protein